MRQLKVYSFFLSLSTAINTLRDNRDTLMSALEPFLKHPVIDWKCQQKREKQIFLLLIETTRKGNALLK